MSWRDIVKAKELTPKQKKLDNNHNGVIDAQDFYIMNEKIDKSPDRKHYTKDGKEWKGKTHKMPNGNLMTEDPHNEKSVRLYHKEELPTDMEKFGYAKEQCPTCGNFFANQRVLDRHEIEAHGSTRRGPATR
tara:strand:+ start:2258 stop:2653 length:396 start_codon:yes stop_codon:yes gene_type:complete